MGEALLTMAVARFTPEEILRSIRFDPLTKKGSVLDVVQLVTGCDQRHASHNFQRLVDNYPELHSRCVDFKFPGRGQRPTPVAHLRDLVEIAWLCPGRNAAEFRRTGAVTLCRTLGGDLSMIDEIRARRAVLSDEDQEALLAGTGVTAAEANAQALVPLNPEEQRALKLRNDREELEIFERVGEMSKRLKAWADEEEDARHRRFMQDTARNMFMRYAAQVTGMEPAMGEVRLPLTLTGVAKELGYGTPDKMELVAIGRAAARLYREAHGGEAPPKHTQYVEGAACQVNSYTTEDRDILEEAVRAVLG